MTIFFTRLYKYLGSILLMGVLASCTPQTDAQKTVKQADDGVFAAALSRDGTLSLMSTPNQEITLYELTPSAKLRFRWRQQAKNNVFIVKFSPDGEIALTASRHDFALWSTSQGRSLGYYSIAQSSIRDIAIANEGEMILVGLENSKVLAINLRTGNRLEFLGHNQAINAVKLSANGQYALSAGNGGTAFLWNTQNAQILTKIHLPSRITQIALEPRGQYMFVAGSHNKAMIYAIPSGKKVSQLAIHQRQKIFSSARFAHQGQWLITGSPNRQLALWDSHSGQLLQQWEVGLNTHHRPASSVVYDATEDAQQRVISTSSSGLVEYWKIDRQ